MSRALSVKIGCVSNDNNLSLRQTFVISTSPINVSYKLFILQFVYELNYQTFYDREEIQSQLLQPISHVATA